MHPFEQLTYDRFAESIASWDTEQHPDIWAISFLCADFGSGIDAAGQEYVSQGQIWLSYNTRSHLNALLAKGLDEDEAKWNFAYWPQDVTAYVPRNVGKGGTPPADELALRDSWCATLGVLAYDADEGGRPVYDEEFLNPAIHAVCQKVAMALHENGVIEGKLGRPVPIVIQDLEQTEGTTAATKAANPPGLFPEIEAML